MKLERFKNDKDTCTGRLTNDKADKVLYYSVGTTMCGLTFLTLISCWYLQIG